jgi:myosin heavy subunit
MEVNLDKLDSELDNAIRELEESMLETQQELTGETVKEEKIEPIKNEGKEIEKDISEIKSRAESIDAKVKNIEDNLVNIVEMIEKLQSNPQLEKEIEKEKRKNEEEIKKLTVSDEELEKQIKEEKERINKTKEEIEETKKKIFAKIKDLREKFELQKKEHRKEHSEEGNQSNERYLEIQQRIKTLEDKIKLLDKKEEEIKTLGENRLNEINKRIKELVDNLLDKNRFIEKLAELSELANNKDKELSTAIKEFIKAYNEKKSVSKKTKNLIRIYSQIEKKKESFDNSIREREKYEEEIKKKFKENKRNFYYIKLFNQNSWKEKNIIENNNFQKFAKRAEFLINNLKEHNKKLKYIEKFKFKNEYNPKITVYWETKELTKEIKKLKQHSKKLKTFINEAKEIIINTNTQFMKDEKRADDFNGNISNSSQFKIKGNANLQVITYCTRFILYILERIDSIESDKIGYKEIYEKLNSGVLKEQKNELYQFLNTNEWNYNLPFKPALVYIFIERLKELAK